MQLLVHWSFIVPALPSSQEEPGRAVPPGTPRQSITRPAHSQSAVHVSLPVIAYHRHRVFQVVPDPLTTPRQSISNTVPAHLQSLVHWSFIVPALPSSQEEPGRAVPPGIPRQSITRPAHSQSAVHVSFPVPASTPSSQGVPGSAAPFTTPKQSIVTTVPWQVQFASQMSFTVFSSPSSQAFPGRALPLGTPKQSKSAGVPVHTQFAFSTSLIVLGSPSLQLPIWPGVFGQLSCALQTPSPSVSPLGVPAHAIRVQHIIDRARIIVIAGANTDLAWTCDSCPDCRTHRHHRYPAMVFQRIGSWH